MALTELQIPTKSVFYSNVQVLGDEIYRSMERWEAAAAFLDSMGTADLDSMGVATGEVRTDLIDFSNFMQELVSLWNDSSVTPAKNPKTVIAEIRHMVVIPG